MQKKKQKKKISSGIANIKSCNSNTIISISDMDGNVICAKSAGSVGFKGAKKKTAFAAETAARSLSEKSREFGIYKLSVIFKGDGKGRESSIRAFKNRGIRIISIEDKTTLPRNGCRPPKSRRL